MTRTRRALSMLGISAAAVMFLGCAGIFTKDSYWDDVKKQVQNSSATGEDAQSYFLGIRAPSAAAPYQLGVPVQHVFDASPAAAAGIQKGDEIRSVGGVVVRTVPDLHAALAREKKTDARRKLIYARDGQEYASEVRLVPRAEWLGARRDRLLSASDSSETEIPLFFKTDKRVLLPEFIHGYYGVTIEDPLVIYRDVDFLPIVLGISLLRCESSSIVDGGRYLFLMWPLRLTTTGEDKSMDLRGLIPPPPEGTEEL
jgi:hypothetical protein